MTLPRTLGFARRWLWLLFLATVVAGGASYAVSMQVPRVYEGTAKLLVTPGETGNGVANYNDVLAAERLTRTYAEVLRTRPIVEAAAQQAGINLPYENTLGLLDVKPLANTQLIQISARGNTPDVAALFANQLAAAFIRYSEANQANRFASSRDSLSKQIDQLSAAITQRGQQIDEARAQPPSAARDTELTRLQAELAQIQQSHAVATRGYQDILVAQARSSDLLAVVDPASPNPNSVQPRVLLNTLLAAVLGLLATLGVVVLLEYLDDRLRSPEHVTRFLGLHTLGNVFELPKGSARTFDRFVAQATRPAGENGEPDSALSAGEAFRLLRANLQFAAIDKTLSTLLVTSSEAGDGKTTIAANLAVVIAQAGQRVLLIDADLRRPTLHDVFGVPNRTGLTSLLLDERHTVSDIVVPTNIAGLHVVPSGPLPPNPSELLASSRMQRRLQQFIEAADLVIIDSPPVLPVSDPAVLAGLTDGTLLVVNGGKTRGQQAAHAVATLQKAGAHVLGVVLNRVSGKGSPYYSYQASGYRVAEPTTSSVS